MEYKPMVDPITLVYKTVTNPDADGNNPQEVSLHLDVYLPHSYSKGASISESDGAGVPVVVYFHGGGLLVGNRKSWFPEWLRGRLSAQGIALLSPDYRLLVPSTGHDVVEDIRDLFTYIENNLNSALAGVTEDPKQRIDTNTIAVAGSSAGGLCTYLSVMHVSPKPKALLSIYGQGGEFLNDNLLDPKAKPWIPGRELVEPSDYAEFIFPQSMSLPVTAESPLEYYPSTHPTPGLPATKRMYLTRLYYQLGEWLDYYTGDHTLSSRLRLLRSSSTPVDSSKAGEVIGEKNIGLFPQFGVTENWPPTLFVHGSEDTQVQLRESEHLAERLRAVGVENELIVVEGQAHSFDSSSNAEEEFGRLFDRAAAFLVQYLR